ARSLTIGKSSGPPLDFRDLSAEAVRLLVNHAAAVGDGDHSCQNGRFAVSALVRCDEPATTTDHYCFRESAT
ncbi:MAG TPA: hypothetical protein VFG20_07345, partial [Planctomycetaceae bacterium]|nr:hypothetical protein [Planctomycetaceae bacterium]